MYTSYLELLKAVNSDGELVSPSNVSENRSFETKELNNIQLKLEEFEPLLISKEEASFYEKELQWYFDSYEKPVHAPIELNHEKWDKNPVPKVDKFAASLRAEAREVIGCVNRCGPNSNYGEMCLRLKNHIGITQLQWVIKKLSDDQNSRQAIAFYNSPSYQYWSNDDFVCCLTQMFNIKDGKLNTVINSRSNDLLNGFRFDSIWWRIFQEIVLKALLKKYPWLKIGYMLVNMFSAHFYLKDKQKIEKIEELAKQHMLIELDKSKFEDLIAKEAEV